MSVRLLTMMTLAESENFANGNDVGNSVQAVKWAWLNEAY